MRKTPAAELDQLGRESWSGPGHVDRLYYGFQFLAHLLTRNAEYRDIGNCWVQNKKVLDLLRVNVYAARYDHVDTAIREIEIAFAIDVADIAQTRPTFVIVGCLRLYRIVVIREREAFREIDVANLARRHFLAIVAEDFNIDA
jgi:hypothetical protein